MQAGKRDVGGGRGGGFWGKMGSLLPYITMGALGLDAIVYVERLFSLPQWKTNVLASNEIKKYDQIRLSVPKSTSFIHQKKKKKLKKEKERKKQQAAELKPQSSLARERKTETEAELQCQPIRSDQ